MTKPSPETKAEFHGLSKSQKRAVLGGKNIFLSACPGAGKTTSVAARVAAKVRKGKRLALLSYTNVGAREIASATVHGYGIALDDQQFVGTLHSFLFRYLVRPFGHLVTGADRPLTVDNEIVQKLFPEKLKSDDFKYNADRTLRYVGKGTRRPSDETKARDARVRAAELGFINHDDTIEIALWILQDHKEIAAALASRFDEIIVDEAQDTNASTLACLRELHDAGLKSLVLVGDYDQSIYEFTGASPDKCDALAKHCKLKRRQLKENFRSSQAICNVTAKVRGAVKPDIAAGPYKDLGIAPILIRYRTEDVSLLPELLQKFVDDFGLDASSKSVLVHSRITGEKIRGASRPQIPRNFAPLISAATAANLTQEHYRELESLLLRRAFDKPPTQLELDKSKLRNSAARLLSGFAPFEGTLLEWATKAVSAVDEAASALLVPGTSLTGEQLLAPPSWSEFEASSVEAEDQDGVLVDTIHGAKGMSIDAVMLVAEVGNSYREQARSWASALADPIAKIDSDLRLGYVGLTRARQLLVLAVPESTRPDVMALYASAGFAAR
ncbi:UvrD-helicase domain-containing protein [Salinibacterium sp. SWN167]|uniref:UvrD-helicase domain-containing protein n=1 Tax=Salinibacterium sp. SWN167 TaxID=2792054 RepID=UPI0018CE2720|nr:ATP-dependent helicase [Salinibacterium sp. SWN167]MBH0084342.1 ATP-dependent helicase [Salinibacterium sp. SWN167]